MTDLAAFDGEALGSPLRLVLRARRRLAERAWDAVREEMAAADRDLSGHRDDSALAALNAASVVAGSALPRRLRIALGVAWRAYRSTDGLFDPRMATRVSAAASARDPWLRRCGRSVRVSEPIDLGGVGKGLALRWSAARLRLLGITDFLLTAGGDLVASGRPDAAGWRVSLAAVDLRRPAAVLELPERHRPMALATSAVTRKPGHIIDPRSGAPVDGPLAQMTIAGTDPAWAEVASKVALIRGGAPSGATGWWLASDGRLGVSSAGRPWLRWASDPVHG